jgi:hypothetical protein
MKKIIGISGIIIILLASILISPALASNIDENYQKNELNRKLIIVIAGNMKICWEDKELYGFGLIIYNDGELSTFTNYNVNFEGLPFFIHKGITITLCIYKPA